MDITEQDIRESVEYKGNKKSIKFIAAFTGIFSLIYSIFFLTMILIFANVFKDKNATIKLAIIWIIFLVVTQLTFWLMFTYYESKNRRLLHHYMEMHSFEPIFDNLEKKGFYLARRGRRYRFVITINCKNENIQFKTRTFSPFGKGIFDYRKYQCHKVLCLLDIEKERINIIRTIN